jgi:hypothetical protein
MNLDYKTMWEAMEEYMYEQHHSYFHIYRKMVRLKNEAIEEGQKSGEREEPSGGFDKLIGLMSKPQILNIEIKSIAIGITSVNIFFEGDDGWSRIGEWTTRDGNEIYALVCAEINRLMIPGLKI